MGLGLGLRLGLGWLWCDDGLSLSRSEGLSLSRNMGLHLTRGGGLRRDLHWSWLDLLGGLRLSGGIHVGL